jgi:hypothetical protein
MMSGTLVVHVENRPKDSVVEITIAGVPDWFVNGTVYKNVAAVPDGETIEVGTPVPKSRKLPTVDGEQARVRAVKEALAPLDPEELASQAPSAPEADELPLADTEPTTGAPKEEQK